MTSSPSILRPNALRHRFVPADNLFLLGVHPLAHHLLTPHNNVSNTGALQREDNRS
jgi:hypothetical protein